MASLSGEALKDILKQQSNNTVKIAIEELIDIYQDNWDHLIECELYDQFSYKEFERLKFLKTKELNLLKRVINETSLIYKHEPKREAIIESGKIDQTTQKEIVQVDENYEKAIKDTDINIISQEINKYTNLTNHVLERIVYRDGKLDFDIITFDNCEVWSHPEDWKRIIAIKYYIGLNVPKSYSTTGSDSVSTAEIDPKYRTPQKHDIPLAKYKKAYLWTLEDIDMPIVDEKGIMTEKAIKGYVYELRQIGEEEQIVHKEENPYRDPDGKVILPFILYSKNYAVRQLLDFTTGNDLRDLNMNVAVNMVHINALFKYQSYKQMVLRVGDPTAVPKNFQLGPAEIAIIGDENGDMSVLDIQTNINILWETLQKRIVTVLSQYGISPENFTLSGTPQSGFSIKMNNIAKLEYREAQIPLYRKYEQKRFDVIRAVWNEHHPVDSEKISDRARFKIDFAEIQFPLSPDEKSKQFMFLKQNNAKTDIDLIMEINPDLTEEEAKIVYEKNKAFNEANRVMLQPAQQPGQGRFNAFTQRSQQKGNQ